jgi:hypothetical protein
VLFLAWFVNMWAVRYVLEKIDSAVACSLGSLCPNLRTDEAGKMRRSRARRKSGSGIRVWCYVQAYLDGAKDSAGSWLDNAI